MYYTPITVIGYRFKTGSTVRVECHSAFEIQEAVTGLTSSGFHTSISGYARAKAMGWV